MVRVNGYCALTLLVAASGLCAWADEDEGLGDKLATWQLVPTATLAADKLGAPFGLVGTETLERGRVDVRRKRRVEFRVEGAAPSAVYNVFFCRPLPSCEQMGTLETDSRGDAFKVLPFNFTGQAFAGIFTLSRNGAHQFATGFRFPPDEGVTATGVELRLKGPISFINPGNNSFRLDGLSMDIFVGPGTEFDKIAGFAALKVGQVVEVKAFTRTDGTVLATDIAAAGGDEDEDGPGKGHGNGPKHD